MASAGAELQVYDALPGRVVFGVGALAAVADELARLGGSRILVCDGLIDAETSRHIEGLLGKAHVGTIGDIRQHVPEEDARRARERADELGADSLLALGGGSATGLAKAIALERPLPILAVPTTYAGSEMTPIWGITADGRKRTGRDLTVLPRTVLYDPRLTVSLPPGATAASGMNAVAHCVEALWTESANPVTDALAGEGLRLLAHGLRGAVERPDDLEARVLALRGAWLGGSALAAAGTALHHKICHVLGGAFDLPHAEVHAAVLPQVTEFFREAAPDALDRVARELGADDAVDGLRRLASDLDVGGGLAALGMEEDGIETAAEMAAAAAGDSPTPATRDDVRGIIERSM